MQPFSTFSKEIKRMESLYFTSLYTFGMTCESFASRIANRDQSAYQPTTFTLGTEKLPLAKNLFELYHKLNRQLPRYLRETIFVRIISALEVYLIDVIKYLFLSRRDLFYKDGKVELTYQQLLSANSISSIFTTLLNKQCRRLQNDGFESISNFYNKRLGIDFNRLPGIYSALVENHHRRNILVHRLGKTDDNYRHKHKSSSRILTVDESYLVDAFSHLKSLADLINTSVNEILQKPSPIKPIQSSYREEIVIEVLSDDGKPITDAGFQFLCDDQIVHLNDIVVSCSQDGNVHTLLLKGKRDFIQKYIKDLRKQEKMQRLRIISRKKGFQLPTHDNLSIELLDQIKNALPAEPWPAGIHKQIAASFNITNRMAYHAIQILTQRKELRLQNAPNES